MAGYCNRFRRKGVLAAVLLVAASVAAASAVVASQTPGAKAGGELVANLASGRVAVLAAKDGLVIASVAGSFEPGGLAPVVIPQSEGSVVVALGAVDWVVPPSNRPVLQLASQLPRLITSTGGGAPSLSGNTTPSHLDQIGLAVLEPLRTAAHHLHAQIHLPQDLPLLELVIVRQSAGEEPSVWDVSYWLSQRSLEENFWDTEVERPRYYQLYPTKENRTGGLEISYPPDDSAPGLLAWLEQPSGRLAAAIQANPRLAETQRSISEGKGKKLRLAQLVPLAKLALQTMVPAGTPKAMVTLDNHGGFDWVIQPPPTPATQPKRPPGAPTLETHP